MSGPIGDQPQPVDNAYLDLPEPESEYAYADWSGVLPLIEQWGEMVHRAGEC